MRLLSVPKYENKTFNHFTPIKGQASALARLTLLIPSRYCDGCGGTGVHYEGGHAVTCKSCYFNQAPLERGKMWCKTCRDPSTGMPTGIVSAP